MSFVIGTVNALVGQVIAVAEDGSSRILKLGDAVLNTEVIRTVEGAQIEVALANGETVSIANAGEWLAEQALTPQTLAQIQFQSTPIGTVNSVSGNAVAVAADGSERVLLAGDSIYPGEIIRTSPDSAIQIAVDGASPITIGGGDSWVATSDTYTPTQDFDPTAAASSDIDAIQAAILAGVDPTQNAEATAAGGETPTEDGGSSFVTLERTAAEVNPEAGFDTVGLNQTITPFNEEPAFVAALTLSTPEDPDAPTDGRNTAQFTDNFVNGVEYYNYDSKSSYDADASSYTNSGLTGDRGTPGSFSYTETEFMVFKIGAVIVAEFPASQIDGPYLFIQDLNAGLTLADTNEWQVENTAIFLQALDSDIQDSNGSEGFQTNEVSNSEQAFESNINITAEIREAFSQYVDPRTGDILNLQSADKVMISRALATQGIEFTRQTEVDPNSEDGMQNVFETIAIDHVVGTIEDLAGDRAPASTEQRIEDTIDAGDGVITYYSNNLPVDSEGNYYIEFDAEGLLANSIGKQVMTNNMDITDVQAVVTLPGFDNPVGTVTYDDITRTGRITLDGLSAEDLESGALETLNFGYTIWDWTANVQVTVRPLDLYKAHLSAEVENVDESVEYNTVSIKSSLTFETDQKLTVKFAPEGGGENFAEYSDDFRVPVQYSNDGGDTWVDMPTLPQTYNYVNGDYVYDKPLPIFEFTLAAGSDSVLIRIPIWDDVEDEGANTEEAREIIDMLIEGENFFTENVQPGIIDNDPSDVPYVDVNFAVVSESDDYADLTITLHDRNGNSATANGDVTVTYQLLDLSATGGTSDAINSGNDYVDSSDTYTITIPSGDSSFVVRVPIIDDLNIETTEFALIDLLSVTGKVVGEANDLVIGDPQGTIRIYDNDALNVVGQQDYEGNDAVFSVTVDPEQIDAGAIITLRPTNSGASATPVDDFDPTTLHAYTLSDIGEKVEITLDENLSFELGGREQFYVAYETTQDQVIESPETVRIQVSAEFLDDQGDQVERVGLGTATIVDPIIAANDADSFTETELETGLTISGSINVLTNDTEPTPDAEALKVQQEAVDVFTSDGQTVIGVVNFAKDGSYTLTLNAAGQAAVNALDADESLTVEADYTAENQDGVTDTATLTVTINATNDKPTITSSSGNPEGANDVVYESGLATGSSPSASSVVAAGTITVADPDGLDDIVSITIDSDTFTLAQLNAATAGSPLTVTGDKGTLSITDYTDGVATYSYTLTSAVDDDEVGASTQEVFSVTTSDGTLSSDPASITIDISDDAPRADDDANSLGEDDTSTSGNVFGATNASTNNDADIAGADGASVTAVRTGAEDATGTSGSLGVALQGTYGTLTLGTDGQYTYTLTADMSALDDGESETDTFTYTITDGDSETDTAELVVTINGSNDKPTISTDSGNTDNANDTVYEAGLTSGSGIGSTATTVGGTITVADPDGLDDIESITIDSDTFTVAELNGASSESPLTVTGDKGTLSITDYTDGVATYSYTLTSAVDDDEVGASTQEVFSVTTSDGTWSSVPAYITIDISDDAPRAENDNTGSLTEDSTLTLTGNVLDNDVVGADEVTGVDADAINTDIFVEWAATDAQTAGGLDLSDYGTLSLNLDGSYSFALDNSLESVQALTADDTLVFTVGYTMQDADGDESDATLSITITGTNDAPVATANSNTIAEDAVAPVTGNMVTDNDGNGVDSDTDISDVLTVSNIDATGANQYGTLTLTNADGSYSYAIDNTNAAVQALAVGETLTETYTYTLSDGNGGTDTATLTITITGTNDAPVIAGGSTDASGAVTELADLSANELTGTLSDSGTITFTDADSTDTHDATVVTKSYSGSAELGSLTLSDNVDNTDGTIGWAFSVSDAAVDFMREGDTITQVYTVTIDDGNGGTVDQDITVVITGTNDAPILTVDATGGVTEDAATPTLTDSGTLSFADVDTADTHTVTESYNSDVVWSGGTLSAAQITALTSGFSADSDSWDYSVANTDVQFLSKDETVTFSYDVTVKDDSGASNDSDTETVTITITGTNDAPVIAGGSTDASGAVTELADLSANELTGTLSDSGTITFTDADSTDTHDATVVTKSYSGSAELGSLTLSDNVDNTDGTIGWAFSVSDAAVDFMREGDTITQVYTVTIDDGNGGTVDQDITVVITGTNDAPILTVDATGGVTEDAATPTLTDSGTLSFADVDTADTHTVTESYNSDVVWSGGTLSAAQITALTSGFSADSDSWDYSVANTDVQFLSKDETVTFSYDVTVKDDSGASNDSDTETVTITITGTNDAPVIAGGSTDASGAVTELADLSANELTGTLSDSGTITFTDADSTDTHDATVVTKSYSGSAELGSLTLSDNVDNTDGTIGWAFSVSDAAVDFMREGDTITQVYTVTIDDGNGGTVDQDITVVITGTNDAPILTVDATGGVTEDAATPTLTDSGTLSFADVDTADTHTVTESYNSDVVWSGGTLSAAQITALTSGFSADSDSWDYSVANTDVQFLSKDETVTFSYDVTVKDDSGASNDSDTETVTITITGTNDDPVMSVGNGSVSESGLAAGTSPSLAARTDSGVITLSDVDGTIGSGSDVTVTSDGQYGTASVSWNSEDSRWEWSYELTSAVDEDGADNQSTIPSEDSFDITIDDGAGGVVTKTLTISIADDAPAQFSAETVYVSNGGTAYAEGSLDAVQNIGADGVRSIVFTTPLATGGSVEVSGTDFYLTDSNGRMTSGGSEILLTGFDTGTLVGTTVSGLKVFEIAIDQATGEYVIDFDKALDDGSGFTFSDFSKAPAGNKEWVAFDRDGFAITDVTDPNPDSNDILITAGAHTVNTSSTDIGAANQWIGSGDSVRLDMVTDVRYLTEVVQEKIQGVWTDVEVTRSEGDAGGFDYDSHYSSDTVTFTVMQTKGGGSSSLRVAAFDFDDAGDKTDLGGESTSVSLALATVVVKSATGVTLSAGSDYTVSISGTDVIVSGLDADDTVTVTNPVGSTFEAVEISYEADSDFALGGFGFESTQAGSDLNMSFDLTATDTDGDSITSTLGLVNIQPDASVLTGGTGDDVMAGDAGIDNIVGNAGDDIIFGGAGSDVMYGDSSSSLDGTVGVDTFVWESGDEGTLESPAIDVIKDFDASNGGDILNLSDLLVGEHDGSGVDTNNLDGYFDFATVGGNTEISIRPTGTGGEITQKIILEGVDLGADGSNDAKVLAQLLSNGNLGVDS
ncbi:retention module-containing protein [Marinobacterium sp. LSUCC0821]|uniref:retention module-containing protein n=1 Tax=Marinobacterium sp. LSUCC0821 TaxID=2668067 RepID=UPI00145254FA|nr:retention module-containing protein [Marinobacterium sp. LSUCC0821]QJD70572.1 retention module-containing protein [Marinobacterium sp. LSUCC0821]